MMEIYNIPHETKPEIINFCEKSNSSGGQSGSWIPPYSNTADMDQYLAIFAN